MKPSGDPRTDFFFNRGLCLTVQTCLSSLWELGAGLSQCALELLYKKVICNPYKQVVWVLAYLGVDLEAAGWRQQGVGVMKWIQLPCESLSVVTMCLVRTHLGGLGSLGWVSWRSPACCMNCTESPEGSSLSRPLSWAQPEGFQRLHLASSWRKPTTTSGVQVPVFAFRACRIQQCHRPPVLHADGSTCDFNLSL